jgi:hypothetical protein
MITSNIFRVKRGSGPPPATLQPGEPCYDNNNDAFYIGKITSTSPTIKITPMLINNAQPALRFKPTQSYSFSTTKSSDSYKQYYRDISIIGMGITTNSTVTVKVDPTKNTHLILPFVTIPANNTVRIYSQYSGATVTIDEILIS